MIRKIVSVIGLLAVSFLLPAAGLSCSTDNITASSGQEFTLSAGQTAIISGEDITLKFVMVTADSRCATGVECVWAGEAKCQMLVTYQGIEYSVVLTQSGSTKTVQDLFNQYGVGIQLEPYPESGKQIANSDYKRRMSVTKYPERTTASPSGWS